MLPAGIQTVQHSAKHEKFDQHGAITYNYSSTNGLSVNCHTLYLYVYKCESVAPHDMIL